jgi:glucose-1-phosphatase
MIKAGIFDVGGVLHKGGLFAPGDFTLDHFDLSAEDFNDNFAHKDVISLAQKLKKNNITLAILSNTVEAHALYLTKMGIYEGFDKIIFSHRVNLHKPDPKIFKHTLNELQVKPEEAFFVDDLQENVDAANALGMHGILFTNAKDLEKELKELGVKI